jgi:hypothetical protein
MRKRYDFNRLRRKMSKEEDLLYLEKMEEAYRVETYGTVPNYVRLREFRKAREIVNNGGWLERKWLWIVVHSGEEKD